MDQIEADIGKERRGNVAQVQSENGGMRQPIPVCQGVGHSHQVLVLLDADTPQVGVAPRQRA